MGVLSLILSKVDVHAAEKVSVCPTAQQEQTDGEFFRLLLDSWEGDFSHYVQRSGRARLYSEEDVPSSMYLGRRSRFSERETER